MSWRMRGSLLAVVCVTSLASAETLGQYPPGSPVAYWSFDECSGTIIHDSANAYDVALDDVHPASWAPGWRGCGLDTRQGYASGPHFTDLELLGSFTISFWTKQDPWVADTNPTVVCQSFCDLSAEGSWDAQWVVDGPNGDCAFFLEYSDGPPAEHFTNCGWPAGTPDEPVPEIGPGQWAHVALRFNADTGVADVFIAGSHAISGNWTANTFSNGAELTIGTDHRKSDGTLCSGNHFFQGDIDELLIYDEALTDEQVSELANVTPEPIPSVSSWGFFAMTLLVLAAGTLVVRKKLQTA